VALNFRRLAIAFGSVLLLGATSIPTIQLTADKLTLRAQGVPLSEVLSTLGKQAKLTTILRVEDNTFRTALVTVNFSNVPLEQGLRRLLRDWSYALVQETATGEIKLFILGQSGGSKSVPTPGGKTNSRAETLMEKTMQDKDAALLQASPSRGDRENVQTEETLRTELLSADPEVRLTAVKAMVSAEGGDSSMEDIRQLVEQDPDPQVRAAALDLLILYDPSEEATQVLRNLAAGPDESLREIAVERLTLMEEAAAAAANVRLEPKN
jgi:HEAT repeats